MTTDFYALLQPIPRFEQIFDPARYAPLPADWVLYLTDVQGSTAAVLRGEYRQVNLIGAAGIVAVNNVAKGLAIPYVFGGDGATIAVPPGLDGAAGEALRAVAALSQTQYGLTLRVGRVPVSALYARGHAVGVAKYRLAGDDTLAMFWGDGLGAAEQAIKAEGSPYLLPVDGAGVADLAGLSCRWEPFVAEGGAMLSVLVLARPGQSPSVYREVFDEIMRLAGGEQPAANPVKLDRLKKERLIPSTMGLQLRLHGGGSLARRALHTLKDIFETLLGNSIFMLDVKTPVLDPGVYLPSQVARSDFRKFDGMLRMVVELSEPAIVSVTALLERLREEGRIYYGLHRSRDALMTCAVFSIKENRHVHFIDGGDGGYALAAQQLKKQMSGG